MDGHVKICECDRFLSVRLSFHFPIMITLENPCAGASKASMNCLNQRDYDRDKCLDVFQAYRDCKKAWVRLIIPSLYTLPTSRMLIVPRDETMQGRSPRWEGINGVMHVKATNMIQTVLL